MKTALAATIALLLTSTALAAPVETPHLYEPCNYRLGLFFSGSPDAFEVTSEATNLVPVLHEMAYLHLVVITAPTPVSAYELRLEGLPEGMFITSWVPVPDAGWLNVGNDMHHMAAFGFPQPNSGGVVKLGHWTLFPLKTEGTAELRLTPPTASSLGGTAPALVVDGQLLRVNYTPWTHSGCTEAVAPGDIPPFVATVNGDGVKLDAGLR